MSMNAKFRALSSRLADRLRENPALVRAVIDADAGDPRHPGLPPQLRALLAGLPPELRDRVAESPELQAQFRDAAEIHGASAEQAAETLTASGFAVDDVREAIDIEKAWHGLHYLLAATKWEATEPPGNAVLGGLPIGGDLGYGPARLMASDEVARTANALGALSAEAVRSRFDPEAMTKAELYGGHWEDAAECDWILAAFEQLKEYFALALERGDAMLLYLE
jgi:hypothetical protein